VPRFALGGVAALGASPRPTAGARVAVDLAWRSFVMGLEGRVDAPTEAGEAERRAEIALVLATASACLRRPAGAAAEWGGCALATGGALRGEGLGLDHPRRTTVPYLALGARLQAQATLAGPLGVQAHADATSPLTRVGFVAGGHTVWTTPRLAVAAGIAATMVFP
jgi:hypothetical protein